MILVSTLRFSGMHNGGMVRNHLRHSIVGEMQDNPMWPPFVQGQMLI